MGTRTKPNIISKILEYDGILTKNFVTYILQFSSFKSLQIHGKFLEISCNGIVWLATWMAFIWIVDNKNLYQMQLNMLFALVLDIFIIAIAKAAFRRRRPAVCNDMMTIGPDKFSFPSGHASRSMFVLMFFTCLYPVSIIWWSPMIAWAGSVGLSRLILHRHYILDVTAGIILGILEAGIMSLLWISEDTATSFIHYISNDNLPGPAE